MALLEVVCERSLNHQTFNSLMYCRLKMRYTTRVPLAHRSSLVILASQHYVKLPYNAMILHLEVIIYLRPGVSSQAIAQVSRSEGLFWVGVERTTNNQVYSQT